MKAFGRYGSIGFELIGSIAVGYWIGHWLDKKFDTHWIAFVGFLLGCYTGFRALYRVSKTMQRDIENDERLARGEDPWAEKPKDADDDDDSVPRDANETQDTKEKRDGEDAKR
jgi:F0F1-type ATP synthase assembly protein I